MKFLIVFILTFSIPFSWAGSSVSRPAGSEDKINWVCEKAYNDKASCKRIECKPPFSDWIGTWEGPFVASIELPDTQEQAEVMVPFLDKLRVYFAGLFGGENPKIQFPAMYRPYHNKTVYSEKNCVRNNANGDELIFAEITDVYPEFQLLKAETKTSLLVTGIDSNDKPFLKTWSEERGLQPYVRVEKDNDQEQSIWRADVGGGMTIAILDGRDLLVKKAHKRNVTVILSIKSPYIKFEGPITLGHHTLSK